MTILIYLIITQVKLSNLIYRIFIQNIKYLNKQKILIIKKFNFRNIKKIKLNYKRNNNIINNSSLLLSLRVFLYLLNEVILKMIKYNNHNNNLINNQNFYHFQIKIEKIIKNQNFFKKMIKNQNFFKKMFKNQNFFKKKIFTPKPKNF